jgi:hypothetical protein
MTGKSAIFRNPKKTEKACEVLFGPDFIVTEATLEYLQPEGVKAAYRQRLKDCHPDTSGNEGDRTIIGTLQAAAQWLLSGESPAVCANESVDKSRQNDDFFHKGSLPERKLKLGEYLFYSGKISYKRLISALAWHAYGQPKLGEVMVGLGMLRVEDVIALVSRKGYGHLFGSMARGSGLVNGNQLNTALNEQRRQKKRFGFFFIDKGLISARELNNVLSKQILHNSRFES